MERTFLTAKDAERKATAMPKPIDTAKIHGLNAIMAEALPKP